MKFAYVVVVMCIMVVLNPSMTEAETISCREVVVTLTPCFPYLLSGYGPSQSCCEAIKSFKIVFKNKINGQIACNCMKKAAFFGLSNANAEALPEKCNVKMHYKINTSFDCTSIQDLKNVNVEKIQILQTLLV
uniref:LTP-like protein 1 n=1 Tax=Astragalus sinicus TaxID=47065 RepID=Q07A25_ASTSI|nr:LTP-like protein 1 [Astragalus sinicus]